MTDKIIEIKPVKRLYAEISVPGSKYIANRVLIICALAKGTSVLRNVPDNDDITQVINALKSFGVNIKKEKDSLVITGTGGKISSPAEPVNVGHSGTLMRFITGFASLVKGETIITGSQRIQERPIIDLLEGLNQLGIEADSLNRGFPPVKIKGGTFKGGKTEMNANISSQFVSSILLIAAYAENDVELILESEPVSKSYIDMTIGLMEEFGIKIVRDSYKRFLVRSGQRYEARHYDIPCDWSSASYFLAAAAIVPGTVRLTGIDTKSKAGETKFPELLSRMGCCVSYGNNWVEVAGTGNLCGIDIDMSSMPDIVQTLAVVAALSSGVTTIRGIGHLRYKECDRVADTAMQLMKIGVNAKATKDTLEIASGKLQGTTVDSCNDHRMAMSLAVIGLKIPGIRISNPDCVNKSFPQFWEKLKEIGAGTEILENA